MASAQARHCRILYKCRATMKGYKGFSITLASHACRSGLRGAVGLSLSLFVLLDEKISDSRYRTLSFFFMGIVAFLTTLIQGTSMGPLLQVGLTVLFQPKEKILKTSSGASLPNVSLKITLVKSHIIYTLCQPKDFSPHGSLIRASC